MTRRSLRALIVSLVSVAGIGLSSLAPAATAAQPEFASYIVTVAKGSEQSVQARAKALGGEIGYVYDAALNGFSVRMPVAAAAGLARAAGVERVELDGVVTIDGSQSLDYSKIPPDSWGLDRIDQDTSALSGSYDYQTEGVGVSAFVIDTGINASVKDFNGRVKPGVSYAGGKNGASDCNGHGTHVAGTIGSATYGIAKQVTLIPVRVLRCDGSGFYSDVISGINWVIKNRPSGTSVANMSLGGGYSKSVNDAVANAVKAGVFFAIAAGNSTIDACTTSPASTRAVGAMTVGASGKSDQRAGFSNFGDCVEIFAPGVDITSWNGATGFPEVWSGTSMASPHVAGAAVRFLTSNVSGSTKTPAGIENFLGAQVKQEVTAANSAGKWLLYVAPTL